MPDLGCVGMTLARKYKAVIKECNMQVEGHRGFTEGILAHLVEEWSLMCTKWDDAQYPKMVVNPFHFDKEGQLRLFVRSWSV